MDADPVKCALRGCLNTFMPKGWDGVPHLYCSRYCANKRKR